jgi:hypothetical protein
LTDRDQEQQDRSIELMESQRRLADRQDRWEIVKGLAAIIAAAAVMLGAIIGLSNWWHPGNQPMFPPGTVITIPPAPAR